LRHLEPVSRSFGLDRGQAIDRWYIERFLDANRAAIRGSVLEVGDDTYARRISQSVETVTILHAEDGPGRIVGDLATGAGIPSGHFDCAILTQVLPFIFDVRGAVAHIRRLLRPDGVALVTVPGISQISRYDMDRWGDYWRFTTLSAQRLFEEHFPSEQVQVRSWGNVLAATAFLQGMCAKDLENAELLHADDDYQLLITVRAQRESKT
jgi:hypothetical protein